MLRGGDKPFLTETEYAEYIVVNGSPVINAFVAYEWADVRYIIVKEKHQIEKIISYLDTLGCDNRQIGVFCEDEIYQDVIGYKHNVEISTPAGVPIADEIKDKIAQLLIEKLQG